MTTRFDQLPPRDEDARIRAVVESPRGQRVKVKYEADTGGFVLHRALPSGLTFPYDFGFVAGTRAADGDPLDAMVIHELTSWPGALLPSRPIALLHVVQREKAGADEVANDRVILVPDIPGYPAIDCLGGALKSLLEAFFIAVGRQTHAEVETRGWSDAASASRAISEATVTDTRRSGS